jgi:multisubunit Na+/H+ antiporter MnhG subunit
MELRDLLIALWPVLAFQLILMAAALISIARRGETKKLPRFAWVLIVIFVNIIGPILYFMIGKGEAKDDQLYRD